MDRLIINMAYLGLLFLLASFCSSTALAQLNVGDLQDKAFTELRVGKNMDSLVHLDHLASYSADSVTRYGITGHLTAYVDFSGIVYRLVFESRDVDSVSLKRQYWHLLGGDDVQILSYDPIEIKTSQSLDESTVKLWYSRKLRYLREDQELK
jgi:hypothetical protein